MSITTDPNLWVIAALVFLLGLLIGVFLTAGGRRKWKVSQFVLDILRALPSIDGASRKQFVEAWQSAQERLRREQEAKEGAQERLVRA